MGTLIILVAAQVILSVLVVALITKLAPRDPAPSCSLEEQYGHGFIITAASTLLVSAWFALLAIVVLAVLNMLEIYSNDGPITYAIISMLLLAFLYLIHALFIKCTECNRRIFVQWNIAPKFSISYFGLEGFASIALQVLFKRKFICMHCGKKYFLSGNA